ncbi:MAG: radical SAM protein, partial [Planctomycetaceae bacterium]|nr:radical SAM protein [Planctomycetaceae bacterium]
MTIQRASCADPVEELIRSVYVHIPFCERRCGYCDFSIIANRSELIPRFLSALEKEILSDAADHTVPLKTLYLGGGTPTLLDESQLERLFHILNRFPQDPDCEVTIEANPEGLHLEKLLTLKNLGVNRISLGVQSFDDDQLKQLDRTHSARQAIEISQQIGELFENW